MMPACCARAASEPLPPRPVVWTARCKGVDPALFGCLGLAPAVHKCSYGRQRSSPHGPVQRGHSRAIQRVRISANRDEVLDHLSLRAGDAAIRVRRIV